MEPASFAMVAGLGLLAGLVGGLAGLGGSIIILPGLGLLLGYASAAQTEQHAFQAAAMIVNVLVAIPATVQHVRRRAVPLPLVRVLIPSTCILAVVGVLASNQLTGSSLVRVLGVMLLVVIALTLLRDRLAPPRPDETLVPPPAPALVGIGGLTGFLAGLLGLGGGVFTVAGLRLMGGRMGRVPLKAAIAASSAVMVISSTIGAGVKLATLRQHALPMSDALLLAGVMGPGAMVGAWLGASLVHRLPAAALRWCVSAAVAAAALRMIL